MNAGRQVDVTDVDASVTHHDLWQSGPPQKRIRAAVWVPDALLLTLRAPDGDELTRSACVRHLVHLYNRIDGRRSGSSLFGTSSVEVDCREDGTVELHHRWRLVGSHEVAREFVASVLADCFRDFESVVEDPDELRRILEAEEYLFEGEEHGIVELYDVLREK